MYIGLAEMVVTVNMVTLPWVECEKPVPGLFGVGESRRSLRVSQGGSPLERSLSSLDVYILTMPLLFFTRIWEKSRQFSSADVSNM